MASPGRITVPVTVLPDFGPEKMRQSAKLEGEMAGLADPDLLRVISASVHELLHRYPDKGAAEVLAATHQAIGEAHALGIAEVPRCRHGRTEGHAVGGTTTGAHRGDWCGPAPSLPDD